MRIFNFKELHSIKEAMDLPRKEFIDLMGGLYDAGEEQIVNKAIALSAEFKVSEIINKHFENRLPNAQEGSAFTLINKINALNVSPDEKLELAQGIADGTAYDIVGMMNSTTKTATDILPFCKTNAAKALMPWFVAWKAAPSGARGLASTEIFMICCGKGGEVPTKGDAIVDGTKIEVKSYKDGYDYEFTVNGDQQNGRLIFPKIVSTIEKALKAKGATDIGNVVFGPALASFKTGRQNKKGKDLKTTINRKLRTDAQSAYLDNYAFQCQRAKMSARDANKLLVDTIKSVTGSKIASPTLLDSKFNVDTEEFLKFVNCCALDFYSKEEGFDKIMIFNQKTSKFIVLNNGTEMWNMRSNLVPDNIYSDKYPGQNGSVAAGGFKF